GPARRDRIAGPPEARDTAAGDLIMAGFDLLQKGAEGVARVAGRLGVRLSRADGGWALDGLPFSMAQLGYPNLHDAGAAGRIGSLSLREADHFLRLCEKRLLESRRPGKRPHESFIR